MRSSEQQRRHHTGRMWVIAELQQINVNHQVQSFQFAQELPKLDYHFDRHGELLGCEAIDEYEQRFRLALQRPWSEIYVLRQSATRPVLMWYVIDKASHEVVQFSQQTGKPVSFYLMRNWRRFLEETEAVRVIKHGDVWEVQI